MTRICASGVTAQISPFPNKRQGAILKPSSHRKWPHAIEAALKWDTAPPHSTNECPRWARGPHDSETTTNDPTGQTLLPRRASAKQSGYTRAPDIPRYEGTSGCQSIQGMPGSRVYAGTQFFPGIWVYPGCKHTVSPVYLGSGYPVPGPSSRGFCALGCMQVYVLLRE